MFPRNSSIKLRSVASTMTKSYSLLIGTLSKLSREIKLSIRYYQLSKVWELLEKLVESGWFRIVIKLCLLRHGEDSSLGSS